MLEGQLNFFWSPPEPQVRPDGLFKNHGVPFMEYQTAIEACLELLGARVASLPVIIPITASLYTATATLRAGGQPVLLDINPETHQMDSETLETALATFEECVVVLVRQYGFPVDPKLLELVENHVHIIVDDITLPAIDHVPVGTFDVFSLHARFDGAVAFSRHKKQVEDLKIVRSGTLGHHAAMSRRQAASLEGYKNIQENWRAWCRQVVLGYEQAFKEAGLEQCLFALPDGHFSTFPVKVKSMQQISSLLSLSGIQTATGVTPLHFVPEIRQRYTEEPSYPEAEALADKVLLLPVHEGVYQYDAQKIIRDIKLHMET